MVKTLLLQEVIYGRITAIPISLNDVQGYSPKASLFKWKFSYKISTDIPRRAVPLT